MTRVSRLATPVAALAAVFAASLAYQRIFLGAAVLPTCVLSAGMPFLAAATAARRAGRLAALLAGLAATAVAAFLVAAFLADPPMGAAAARGVVSAVTSGWSQILTTTIPTAPTAERLGVVALTTGVASSLAVTAAASRRPEWAGAPALALFLVALLLGVGGPGSPTAVTVPVAAALLLLLLASATQWRSQTSSTSTPLPPPSRAGRLAGAAAGVLAVGAAALAGPGLPRPNGTFDPREVTEPPVTTSSAGDPVALLPHRLTALAGTVMFSARVSEPLSRTGMPWRLASFDTYDGVGWSASGQAQSVGVTLGRAEATEHAEVHIHGLDGVFVPTIGEPVLVHPPDLRFDHSASTLLDPTTVRAGARYALDVAMPVDEPARISAAPLPGDASPVLTATPCLPRSLTAVANQTAATRHTPAEQAATLATALAAMPGVTNTAQASPGASCGRIAALLASPDQRGTSEQFATAFALAARSLGLPTRLAVGFRPGEPTADGTLVVTGADALAWPEVQLGAGVGWVAFDPTPASAGDTRPRQNAPLQDAPPAAAANPPSETPSATQQSEPVANDDESATVTVGRTVMWAVLLGVVFYPVTVLSAKVVRRRRRAARAEPQERVVGAWQELLERLAELGLHTRACTASEVTEALVDRWRVPPTPAAELAELVNRAVYDPSPLCGEDAQRAWAAASQVIRAVRGATGWMLRLRCEVDPRALWPARRHPVAGVDASRSASPLIHRNGPVAGDSPSAYGTVTTKQ